MILKYILLGLHDINIAQALDFMGYFKDFKDARPIDFLASLRFEIV